MDELYGDGIGDVGVCGWVQTKDKPNGIACEGEADK